MNRARATLPMIAALLRTEEAELLAQHIEEDRTRFDLKPPGCAIDFARDGYEGGRSVAGSQRVHYGRLHERMDVFRTD